MKAQTYLSKSELWPEKLPNSFTNRVDQTIDYIYDDLRGEFADIGEYNPMSKMISDNLLIQIDQIDGDFNFPINTEKKYGTVFCFEVLEHIFNPLTLLISIKNMLRKNGIIYLSTPRQFPQILKAVHHFHEIPEDRLMWLFEAAKLRVLDKSKITIAGSWYNHIHGIRPVLRYFQKTRIYKLEKH